MLIDCFRPHLASLTAPVGVSAFTCGLALPPCQDTLGPRCQAVLAQPGYLAWGRGRGSIPKAERLQRRAKGTGREGAGRPGVRSHLGSDLPSSGEGERPGHPAGAGPNRGPRQFKSPPPTQENAPQPLGNSTSLPALGSGHQGAGTGELGWVGLARSQDSLYSAAKALCETLPLALGEPGARSPEPAPHLALTDPLLERP